MSIKKKTLKDGTQVELVAASAVKPGQRRYRMWAEDQATAEKWAGPASGAELHRDKLGSATFCWVEVMSDPITVEQMAAKEAKPIVPPPLPTEDKDRKALPVFRGPLMYFPHALLEVARVCKAGNDQHNPGQPMHWAREKSTDQMNTALRHMMDHGLHNTKDTDGTYHLAKAAWRILAELQLTVEKDLAAKGT